jgi:predicted nucleic acid-binding protein
MIVVADTSPLNYLLLIDEIDLLPAIFGQVLLPRAIFQELQHPKTSPTVRQWVAHLPAWLEVRTVASVANPALMALDAGEREAIQLALELGVSTVLMDEADGRRQAERLHLEVRGTLGILERGAHLGETNLREALSKLEQTNFRMSPAVRDALLKRNP